MICARHRNLSAHRSCPYFSGLLLADCHTSIFLIKNLSGSTEVFQRRPWRRQTPKAFPPRGGGHQLAVSPAHFFIRPKLFCSRCHTFLSDQNFLLWLSHFLFSAHFFIRPKFFVHIVTLFILRTLFILSCLSRTLFYPTKTFFALVVTLFYPAHFLSSAVSPAHFFIRTLFNLRTLLILSCLSCTIFYPTKTFFALVVTLFCSPNFFCSGCHTFYSPHTFILSCLSRTLFYPTKTFFALVVTFFCSSKLFCFRRHTFYPPHTSYP